MMTIFAARRRACWPRAFPIRRAALSFAAGFCVVCLFHSEKKEHSHDRCSSSAEEGNCSCSKWNWIHRNITEWLIFHINLPLANAGISLCSILFRTMTKRAHRTLESHNKSELTQSSVCLLLSVIKLSEMNMKIWAAEVAEVEKRQMDTMKEDGPPHHDSPTTYTFYWYTPNWIKWTKHEITHVRK